MKTASCFWSNMSAILWKWFNLTRLIRSYTSRYIFTIIFVFPGLHQIFFLRGQGLAGAGGRLPDEQVLEADGPGQALHHLDISQVVLHDGLRQAVQAVFLGKQFPGPVQIGIHRIFGGFLPGGEGAFYLPGSSAVPADRAGSGRGSGPAGHILKKVCSGLDKDVLKGSMDKGGVQAGPLRVLQVISSLPVGGAEDLVAAMVKGLNAGRFQVQAATLGDLGAVGQELARAGYPVRALNIDLKRTPLVKIVARLRGLIREIKPDILHTHLYHPNLYGRLAALGLGLKGVVASVHNSYTRVKVHRCLWNFVLSAATDKVLVSSPRVWQDVRTWDRVPAGKLEIFPYGVRVAELDVPLDPADIRAELGVGGFVLGLVGRLEEQKGQRYLLAALPELARQIPDLAVLLVGEGRERQALEGLAEELGVSHLVRFLGTRRDLPRVFRALDLFVHPSLWEGLPLTLLMAMGARLPVVGTRVSGITEVIADGNNGLLVPPGDSQALAAAILEMYRSPELRRRLAEAARRTVMAEYSQEAMLRRLERLYLHIVEGKTGP